MGIVSGDFVFVGDVGRPDLLESAAGAAGSAAPSAERLYASLQRFDRLPEYLQVWPGHGAGSACGKALGAVPQTTVGYERRMNAALDAARGDRERFVEMIIDGQPEPPLYFSRMKRENRDGPALLGEIPKPGRLEGSGISEITHDAGITIVDTRPWDEFRRRHLRGSLHAPMTMAFPTVVGSYVRPEKPVVLVVDEARLDEAVIDMIRIGLDTFAGYILPEDIAAIADDSPELRRSLEIEAEQFVRDLDETGGIVLDVRGVAEYDNGHTPEALNIPHTRLADRLDEIPRGTTLFVYCQSGVRSAAATAYLESAGFEPINVAGGYARIAKAGIPAMEQK
jgi:hydroxyacylglutathione hydrolase